MTQKKIDNAVPLILTVQHPRSGLVHALSSYHSRCSLDGTPGGWIATACRNWKVTAADDELAPCWRPSSAITCSPCSRPMTRYMRQFTDVEAIKQALKAAWGVEP